MAYCYKCNTVHQGLGLCPSCLSARNENKEPQIEESNNYRSNNYISTSNILALFGVLFAVILFAVWGKIFPKPALAYASNGYFEISNDEKSSVMRFAYEESASVQGYVLDYESQSGSIEQGGVRMALHYLTESSYLVFKKQFGNSKQCPAGFYNSNIQHLMVLAVSENCKNYFSTKTFDNWGQFSLSGKYAVFSEGFNKQGKVRFPGGNYRFFIADTCR